jgi:hypothetical protein
MSKATYHLSPVVLTKRRRPNKDGGKPKPKRKTVYATTICEKHGKSPVSGLTKKEITCAVPTTRADRYSGCPLCAAENRAAKIT